MIIEKKQTDPDNFKLDWHFFCAAREALKYILSHEQKGKKILLPAYIGYSSHEGSGVFDPVKSTGTDYDFYSLDGSLNIDLNDVSKKIIANKGNILFLIHYFGFKDRNLETIKNIARHNEMVIVEDFAHAFYGFWLNPVIDFDFAIFSTHKMFPVKSGGALLSRTKIKRENSFVFNYFAWDVNAIIKKRIRNYEIILKELDNCAQANCIEILRNKLDANVPQIFPLLIKDEKLRDLLYFELNNKGYGVISLYHELISQLPNSYKTEKGISTRILNLPVHQDVNESYLRNMIKEMLSIIKNHLEWKDE